MKRTLTIFGTFAIVAALVTVSAFAAVIINDDGTGFVGKGDVQLAFGWNNAQLQQNAAGVTFRYDIQETTVSESTWDCYNSNNGKYQERSRTVTTISDSGGLISAVARVKNQITGFNLNGFSTPPAGSSSSTEGPALNSCPNANGNWSYVVGSTETTETTTGGGRHLYVIHNGNEVELVP